MEKFPEVISIHVGEAGCRAGLACWETILTEHGVLPNGNIVPGTSHKAYSESMLCLETDSSLRPRAVFIDTHPAVVDQIKIGDLGKLWWPNCLITGKESAGWNFARGYLAEGPQGLAEATVEAVRQQAERCDSLEAFLILRGLGGGTGSGVSASILRKLKEDFCKKLRCEITMFPSSKLSSMLADCFNVVLGIHATMESTDCCFLLDNDACYDICVDKLKVLRPGYCHINALISQVVSGLTAIARFPNGCPGLTINDLVETIVPAKRLHFPVMSYLPLTVGPPLAMPEPVRSPSELIRDAFTKATLLAPSPAKPTSAAVLFRGSLAPTEVAESLEHAKGSAISEIPPSKVKIALCSQPVRASLGGPIAESSASLTVAAASGAAGSALSRATTPARTFWGRRAYVHHFISEGLETDEIRAAIENMESLVDDHDVIFPS